MASSTIAPPSITVTIAIEPPTFTLGSIADAPIITVTATSHASGPITIFTWPTIFNLPLALRRANFTCLDLDTKIPVWMELTKGPKRPGFNYTKGGPDDNYFLTLEPEIPVSIRHVFWLSQRSIEGKGALVEGHRYRFSVREGARVGEWWYGAREDVMAPPGRGAPLVKASGRAIELGPIAQVNFEVMETASNYYE